jgi:DNA-binding protein HU-beta
LFERKNIFMTKADIVAKISEKTGVEKKETMAIVEAFMSVVKNSMCEGKNVYLRGFGTLYIKKRAKKPGRIISRNTTIMIPAHNIPAFKPAKSFGNKLKKSVPVTE